MSDPAATATAPNPPPGAVSQTAAPSPTPTTTAPVTTPTTSTESPAAPAPTPSLISEPTPAAPAGAPEAYTDFTPPEGGALDPKAIEAISPVLRELGLSQDQAQKLVTLQASREADIAEQFKTAARAQYEQQRSADRATISAEFGTRLPEVRAEIGRALNLIPADLRDPFRSAMDVTGAGDNPAFVRTFYALAKLVNDGKPVNGGPTGDPTRGRPATQAQAIYGSTPSAAPQSGRTA